ncbi:DUF2795 domain-containing protein [Streptomyces collinus]|uniref:DUF2795 domain-containing protein n=1 Tax=Streptomyces collinus TaxID=42684 RepID=UPI0033E48C31
MRVDPDGPVPPPGEEGEQARATAEADSLRLEPACHLERAAFPADRQRLLDVLEAHHAPDSVLDAARNLPESGEHADVTEVVRALGGESAG